MIYLSKFNKEQIILNALYIERVESTPDTVITLVSGKKILVSESADEVQRRVTDYYKGIGMFREISAELLHRREEGEGNE